MSTAIGTTTPASNSPRRAPSARRRWALTALVFTLLGAVTGTLYFSVGGVFALLSDLAAFGMGVSIAMLMLLFRPAIARSSTREGAISAIGLVGAALATLGSAILVTSYLASLEGVGGIGLAMQFLGFPIQGAWLTAVAVLTLRRSMLDRTTGWFGLVAGLGYLSFVVSIAVGPQHVVSMAGGFLGVVAMIGWLLRLWRARYAELVGDGAGASAD